MRTLGYMFAMMIVMGRIPRLCCQLRTPYPASETRSNQVVLTIVRGIVSSAGLQVCEVTL